MTRNRLIRSLLSISLLCGPIQEARAEMLNQPPPPDPTPIIVPAVDPLLPQTTPSGCALPSGLQTDMFGCTAVAADGFSKTCYQGDRMEVRTLSPAGNISQMATTQDFECHKQTYYKYFDLKIVTNPFTAPGDVNNFVETEWEIITDAQGNVSTRQTHNDFGKRTLEKSAIQPDGSCVARNLETFDCQATETTTTYDANNVATRSQSSADSDSKIERNDATYGCADNAFVTTAWISGSVDNPAVTSSADIRFTAAGYDPTDPSLGTQFSGTFQYTEKSNPFGLLNIDASFDIKPPTSASWSSTTPTPEGVVLQNINDLGTVEYGIFSRVSALLMASGWSAVEDVPFTHVPAMNYCLTDALWLVYQQATTPAIVPAAP